LPEFKNPNQGAGGGRQDSSSFLLMVVVMFAVLFGLRWYQSQHTPPAAPDANTQSAPVSAPVPAAATAATSESVATVQAASESTTVIENEVYRITFSNRGAQVTSWILKKFQDAEGRPLDLVHDGAARLYGYPLSLYTYDPTITQTLAQGLYVPSATGTLQQPATLSYDLSIGHLVVHKTFTFGADYVVHADAVVLRDGYPIRALLSWPGGFGDMESSQAYISGQTDISVAGKDKHEAAKSVIGGASFNGPFDFAGVSDQYFAAIFIPDSPADSAIATFSHQIDVNRSTAIHGGKPLSNSNKPALIPVLGAGMGSLSGHTKLRLFVGPKSIPVLKSVKAADGSTLEPVLDFGFWGYIGKFLFIGLHFVQEHVVSNWGWAIVLFTLLINLLLLPLRVQGMKSMLKMQRIQPAIDLIKAKYKNPGPTDPRAAEMNAEVMAYQKSQGVSMFGGCIPSLVQLPLLIAFFTMMNRVVELRQAHWAWIHDLSAADPWHILPITMVLSSFLAQYYTPSPGVDPQQQKMMAFMMPAVSGYMTWNYAAALGLYWNIGNLVMITQQQIMNRTKLGREIRELQKKRADKRTGSVLPNGKPGASKTIQGRR